MPSIVGVRLTKAMQRAVGEIMRQEGVDKSAAIRMLIGIGYKEWRLRHALQLLREGKASVWKAAELAGMNLWDFLQILGKEEIRWVEFDLKENLLSQP